MKTQTAQLNYLRIAPRKVRLITDLIKNLPVSEAEAQLTLVPQKAAVPVLKLLRSAIANAKNNQSLDPDTLFIKEVRVDQGPSLKRFMPRAMGRATPIQKKSSHITLVLAESENLKPSRFKIVKKERIRKEVVSKARAKSEKEREAPKVEEWKAAKKPGFMKKMFRRKSI